MIIDLKELTKLKIFLVFVFLIICNLGKLIESNIKNTLDGSSFNICFTKNDKIGKENEIIDYSFL